MCHAEMERHHDGSLRSSFADSMALPPVRFLLCVWTRSAGVACALRGSFFSPWRLRGSVFHTLAACHDCVLLSRVPPRCSLSRRSPHSAVCACVCVARGRQSVPCASQYIYISWWHPASKNLLRLDAGDPALRCHIFNKTQVTRTATHEPPHNRTHDRTKQRKAPPRLAT